MIKNGSNSLAIQCFADHPGQPAETPKDQDRKKGKGGKTVSSYFKGQLDDLMTTLYKTEPHFIRCVVPNTHKQPGGIGLIFCYCIQVYTLHNLKYTFYNHRCGVRLSYAPVPVQRSACWNCNLQERIPQQGVSVLNYLHCHYNTNLLILSRCCTLSSNRGTISWPPNWLRKQRMTRQQLEQ